MDDKNDTTNNILVISDINIIYSFINACDDDSEEAALKIIEIYGDRFNPGQVDEYGDTALIIACDRGLEQVAIKIIETFYSTFILRFFCSLNFCKPKI
jgi:hypothetical protein